MRTLPFIPLDPVLSGRMNATIQCTPSHVCIPSAHPLFVSSSVSAVTAVQPPPWTITRVAVAVCRRSIRLCSRPSVASRGPASASLRQPRPKPGECCCPPTRSAQKRRKQPARQVTNVHNTVAVAVARSHTIPGAIALSYTAQLVVCLCRSDLYKTEMCRNWVAVGRCSYGNKCRFAHGEHDVKDRVRSETYNTKVTPHSTATLRCSTAPTGSHAHSSNFILVVLSSPALTWPVMAAARARTASAATTPTQATPSAASAPASNSQHSLSKATATTAHSLHSLQMAATWTHSTWRGRGRSIRRTSIRSASSCERQVVAVWEHVKAGGGAGAV